MNGRATTKVTVPFTAAPSFRKLHAIPLIVEDTAGNATKTLEKKTLDLHADGLWRAMIDLRKKISTQSQRETKAHCGRPFRRGNKLPCWKRLSEICVQIRRSMCVPMEHL